MGPRMRSTSCALVQHGIITNLECKPQRDETLELEHSHKKKQRFGININHEPIERVPVVYVCPVWGALIGAIEFK